MPDIEIVRLIEKIRNRYSRMYGPAGNVIRIEADLLLADIRELYEKLSFPAFAEIPLSMQRTVQEEEIIQQTNEPEHNDVSVSSFSPTLEVPEGKPEENYAEPVLEFVPEPDSFSSEPEEKVNQETEIFIAPEAPASISVVESMSERGTGIKSPEHEEHKGYTPSEPQGLDLFGLPLPTLADKFGEEKKSLNEKIHFDTSEDKSIVSKLRQPVSDLRTSIGINDRFLFINELFDGDMRRYDETLISINSCPSLEDALAIFDNTRISMGWTADLESAGKLLEFIHRRFV
jgi:hypothetical protein